MRDQKKDQDLKGLFRHLRADDGRGIPGFEELMNRAREEAARTGQKLNPQEFRTGEGNPRRAIRRLAWGGSLLAAAAAAVILLVQMPGTSDSEFERVVRAFSSDPASGAWTSPTDGLLDLPGTDILSTIPSIGTSRWLMDPRPTPPRNEL